MAIAGVERPAILTRMTMAGLKELYEDKLINAQLCSRKPAAGIYSKSTTVVKREKWILCWRPIRLVSAGSLAMREYVRAQTGYRRNTYERDEAALRRVNERWGFAFLEWGYRMEG